MVGEKRGSKRTRKQVEPEASSGKKQVTKRTEQPQEPATEHAEDERPSGYPFFKGEVTWTYKRLHLVDKPTKVIPAGYETMAGDVNTVLRTALTETVADKARNSVMGVFTRLDDFTICSGKML